MSSRLPKLVAFDLDYTLWPLWIDTHVDGPFRREGNAVNQVFGVDGYRGGLKRKERAISFYRDVPEILHRLRTAEVIIAACSRTGAPENAKETLSLLLMPPKTGSESEELVPAIEFFDQQEIYPVEGLQVVVDGKKFRSSKCVQFHKLHEKTGMPYSEMLFFDDEHRNSDVGQLGVTFCLVSERGVDERTFEEGLAKWRQKNGK